MASPMQMHNPAFNQQGYGAGPPGYVYQAPPSYAYPAAGPSANPNPSAPILGFFNPWEPPPPAALPPGDLELAKRIDKLVEYAAKNGPQFEALMREKQKDSPAYHFLQGGDGSAYYKFRLWSILQINSAQQAGQAPPLPPGMPSGMPAGMNTGIPAGNPARMSSGLPPETPMYIQQQQQHQPIHGQYFDPHSLHPSPPPTHPPPPAQPHFYDHHHQNQHHALPTTDLAAHQQHETMAPPPFALDRVAPPYSGPLPPDVLQEMAGMSDSLTGTKEAIKAAKTWFMQRSLYAIPLAEAFKTRVESATDSEKQLHVLYLINDILFSTLPHRPSTSDLDPVALAFRPVLGPILASIYHHPSTTEQNRDRLRKILDFWGAKDVFDLDTVNSFEGDMMAGPPPPPVLAHGGSQGMFFQPRWQDAHQGMTSNPNFHPPPQSMFSPAPPGYTPTSIKQEPMPAEQPSAYPLFPPGLIPGMVRKKQIGSGVPYSPISPLDIPNQIPHSSASESYINKRVRKFYKTIREVDPMGDENHPEEEEEDEGVGGAGGGGMGGVRVAPPPIMEVDPETGMMADGSVEGRGLGSGRAGLGANEPDEPTQYGDVYSSYRKSRSSNYYVNLSVRASMKYENA